MARIQTMFLPIILLIHGIEITASIKLIFSCDTELILTSDQFALLCNKSSYFKSLAEFKNSIFEKPIEIKEFDRETFQLILELAHAQDPVDLMQHYTLSELVSLAQMIDFLDINALYDVLIHAFIMHCKQLASDQIPSILQTLTPLENTSLITQLSQELTVTLHLTPEQKPDTLSLAEKLYLLVATQKSYSFSATTFLLL